MQMTEEEICRSYRQSAFPKKQIGVLAELNQVTKTEIAEILNRGGCDVILKKGRLVLNGQMTRLSSLGSCGKVVCPLKKSPLC